MNLVASDDGFYNNKCIGLINGENKRLVTPTLVRKGAATSVSAVGDIEKSSVGVYNVDGDTYSVGQVSGTMKRRLDRSFATSNENVAVVHNALHNLGLAGKKVTLCTGLPFNYFYKGGTAEQDSEFIEEKKAAFTKRVITKEGEEVEIERHMVMAQGEAAYYDAAIDVEMKRTSGGVKLLPKTNDEIFKSTVLMLDIGGGSTDPVLIRPGAQIDPDRSGSFEYAGYKLLELAETMFKAELRYSDELPRERYEQALSTGILVFNKNYQEDVAALREKVLNTHFDELMNKLVNVVGSMNDIDLVIPNGGTSIFYQDVIAKQMKRNKVMLLKEPIDANALGMFKRSYVETMKKK